MKIAKLGNKTYEVVKVEENVKFSEEKNWVLLFRPIGDRKAVFNIEMFWVPATTRFEWVRDFRFGDPNMLGVSNERQNESSSKERKPV